MSDFTPIHPQSWEQYGEPFSPTGGETLFANDRQPFSIAFGVEGVNCMQVADVEMVRSVRREMSRHAFDPAEVSVHVSHGIVHLVGRVRPCRGHEHDFVEEIHSFERALRQRPGIRDVMPEWTADGYNLGSTSKTRSR